MAALGCGTHTQPLAPPNNSATATTSDDPPSDPPATPDVSSEEKPKRPANRLSKETSPYLLQHAHNPVDWFPWGEEALEKAKRENKLIFLSVGYSSCHWCHVMERESFLDEEIAGFLNDNFVCIKVDREERPDIDAIYMTAVQLISGHGGWPMSMFLAPDARPFFGGTYWPARDGDRGATHGFLTILQKLQELWSTEPTKITEDAERLTRFVKLQIDGRIANKPVPLEKDYADRVQEALAEEFDPQYGGFGFSPKNAHRPKFPEPSNLLFLLHRCRTLTGDDEATKTKAEQARGMLTVTLDGLASGGIRDHIGGGFHRYSVDRFWRIPHFEKMLYDNGQLASVYAEAFALTGREAYRQALVEQLDFVLRELTAPEGGFYSAIDADSEHEEGKFYRWEKESVQTILSPDEFPRYATRFGLEGPPNFEEHFYVPQFAAASLDEALPDQAAIHAKLLAERNKRVRPMTDTKILTSWNGLMIAGLADAGRILMEDRYLTAAKRAADFALEKLRSPDGRLFRGYGHGQAKLNAYVDDYAFLVDGLLALYRATNEPRWKDEAAALTELQLRLFWDDKLGGFFFTSSDHESLLARGRNPADGAEPSGQSVSAGNLLTLSRLLDRPDWLDKARRTVDSVSAGLDQSPTIAPRMAIVVDQLPPLPNEKEKTDE